MTTAAMDTSLSSILPVLTESLESALPALPTTSSILPPDNGITLLDAKNELFLSYLQTLALRNLAVIRSLKSKDSSIPTDLDENLVKDLVKHRVYLEKGVRPLEDRLKYQIDKVVRAAEDEARGQAQKTAVTKRREAPKPATSDDDENSEDDDGSDDEDQASDIDELAYRPNPNTFTRPNEAAAAATTAKSADQPSDGIYRPPRITATTMPTPLSPRREKSARPMRSNTIDEFVADELSGAPAAQPSIGSTITALGRRDKSARERAAEAERTAYEESNLVRLPKPGKKELAKKGNKNRGAFGGEEWDLLGQGISRIDSLTKKKSGAAKGGVGGALERSRKRDFASEDGPRGSGDMGRDFERRKKRTMRRT